VAPSFQSSPAPGNRAFFISQGEASYLGSAQVKGLVAVQATKCAIAAEKEGTGQRFGTTVRTGKDLSSRHGSNHIAEI
jgi:hypothetical protein